MKSILLIGLGRFGLYMAKRLQELGHEILAVDCNETQVNESLAFVTDAQIGDSTNEAFIQSLGVQNFDLCVVAIGEDFESSLETVALLADNGAQHILARAATGIHERLLLRNGAENVIYPVKLAANYAATRFTTDHVVDFLALTDDFSICEITPPEDWVGHTIAELNVRKKYNINIIAVKEGKRMKSLPGPDYSFNRAETVMIMAHNQDLKRFLY